MTVGACGGGEGDGGGAQAAGEIDRDATLRATYVVPPTPLDPHTPTAEVAQFPYISLVYDRLTQMVHGERGAELAPMVAESWEFSEDGRRLTFTLRDDVTFSDGSPVDAEAVRLSLERALTHPESTAENVLGVIEAVEAPEPRTLIVTTSQPTTNLPYLLSTGFGSITNPKALDKPDLDVAPEGSGAYVVTAYKAGDSVTYERRDGYWDPEAGKAKTVVISGIVDHNARINGVRGGEDHITGLQTQQFDDAESLGNGFPVHSYRQGVGTRQAVYINQHRPYLSDVRVRQALNYAVNRQAIIDALMDGAATPMNQPLAEGEPGHLADPPVNYTYDPDKARELLQQAGVPQGHQVKIVSANYSPVKDIAAAVQAQLGEVGLTATVDYTDSLEALRVWTPNSEYDLSVAVRTGSETPSLTLANSYLVPRALIEPPPDEFRSVLAEAVDPALSDDERTARVEQANRIAIEQAYDVYIAGEHTMMLTSDDVVGADSMGRADYQGIFDLRYVGLSR
jgi:peptide/nickel transport system substrate-binding protein